MKDLRALLRRLYESPVLWSWAMNGFRLASALLLLPLLLDRLPSEEMGMYFLFLNLLALLPIIDFGFSLSVGLRVTYAMGGAKVLQPLGLPPAHTETAPNYELLWQLLDTTRHLFRYMALAALLIMGGIGTWAVNSRVHETAAPHITWLAWAITLASAVLEIYAGWWNVFLRCMNHVLEAARISVVAYAIRFLLAVALLLLGAGLLALPLAGFASSILQRYWSRRHCLLHLGPRPAHLPSRDPALLRLLWPTSWRAGLQFLASYLATHANGIICLKVFGLSTNAAYGLSLQVAMIIQGMASVWTLVKWPVVGQYRARGDSAGLRRVLWARWWLQTFTFLALAATAFFLGPTLLRWHGSGKELVAPELFSLMLLNALFESQFTFWTTLLATENRIPSLWPTMLSNAASVGLILLLIHGFHWGVEALVLAPLLTGSIFGYWYWPRRGARSLQTTWLRYTFLGPDRP